MSVRVTPDVTSLNTREYFATRKQVTAIAGNVVVGSECCFLYPNCEWYLPAIADLTDTDKAKNDVKDFIIQVSDNSTVVGTLIKIACSIVVSMVSINGVLMPFIQCCMTLFY